MEGSGFDSARKISFLGRHAETCVPFNLYSMGQNLASLARWRYGMAGVGLSLMSC